MDKSEIIRKEEREAWAVLASEMATRFREANGLGSKHSGDTRKALAELCDWYAENLRRGVPTKPRAFESREKLFDIFGRECLTDGQIIDEMNEIIDGKLTKHTIHPPKLEFIEPVE